MTQTKTTGIFKALIDLDPIVYQFSSLSYPDGTPMPKSFVASKALQKVEQIAFSCGASSWEGFLTHGPDNFRIALATIRKYKGNRDDTERPRDYEYVRGFLSDLPNVRMVFGMEADDALSIGQCLNNNKPQESREYETVICTIDKDLDMVPGWHHRWRSGNVEEVKPWFQTEIGGLRCFYSQLLTGDAVDNIHGLYGVGAKSTHLLRISEMDDEASMLDYCLTLYKKWYGNYAEKFMSECGQLLWMKRSVDDVWRIPECRPTA